VSIVIEPFESAHIERFRALFDASSSGCFCRYWHFLGNKNEWLERSAFRPEENFEEQAAAVRAHHPSAHGLVAVDRDGSDAVVGWLKVAPRETVTKLTGLPVYRAVAAPPNTWSLGCVLVHPTYRRQGVARSLIHTAALHVGTLGARFLDAHPRRSSVPLHDEEAWQGPESVFVSLGFEPVHDVGPYPLYRKEISRAGI
jgi:GNAT superfamily N-acetyltransferase